MPSPPEYAAPLPATDGFGSPGSGQRLSGSSDNRSESKVRPSWAKKMTRRTSASSMSASGSACDDREISVASATSATSGEGDDGEGTNIVDRMLSTLFGNIQAHPNPDVVRVKMRDDVDPLRKLSSWQVRHDTKGQFHAVIWMRVKGDTSRYQELILGAYDSHQQAEQACLAFSPPVKAPPSSKASCAVCMATFGLLMRRKHHCRNCGRWVCTQCSGTTWPATMLPFTYTQDKEERKCRVCDVCQKMNEDFRSALLSGDEASAMDAYQLGCINLRCPYSIYMNELPVHCAAEGGNLNLLGWLLEDCHCPLYQDYNKTVALGNGRSESVLGIAAREGNLDMMRYLIFTQRCRVNEINSLPSLWLALDKLLHEGAGENDMNFSSGYRALSDCSNREMEDAPRHESAGSVMLQPVLIKNEGTNECMVCSDKEADCTVIPCGHQACCMQCAEQVRILYARVMLHPSRASLNLIALCSTLPASSFYPAAN